MRTHGRMVALVAGRADPRGGRGCGGFVADGWRASSATGTRDASGAVDRHPAVGTRSPNVAPLHAELSRVSCDRWSARTKRSCVDDGSVDRTFARLLRRSSSATRMCGSSGSRGTSARPRRSPPGSPPRAARSSSPPTATCRTTPRIFRGWSISPESHDIVCGWRKDRQGRLPDPPSAVGGGQLAAWPRLRHPAARQRLLAESVSRRGGQAAEAAPGHAPLPAGARQPARAAG